MDILEVRPGDSAAMARVVSELLSGKPCVIVVTHEYCDEPDCKGLRDDVTELVGEMPNGCRPRVINVLLPENGDPVLEEMTAHPPTVITVRPVSLHGHTGLTTRGALKRIFDREFRGKGA